MHIFGNFSFKATILLIALSTVLTYGYFTESYDNPFDFNHKVRRDIVITDFHSKRARTKKQIDLKTADPAIAQMWGVKKMKALEAWNKLKVKGSKKIIVAVIDTGIDVNHPDLAPNLWINAGETGRDIKGRKKSSNGIDDDKNGCIDDVHGCNLITGRGNIEDSHGHGTHIAGIIGARGDNGIGISGVSPNVSLMALKYYDPSATGLNNLTNTVRAIDYAINNNAHIINYSGGGTEPSPSEKAAIARAQKKGILFVAAAGNEKSDSDVTGYYPANYELNNIISVTAINKAEEILPTSNYGRSSVDIAAPGNDILSTIPKSRYGKMTGTSQATAFVSGVAALIRSRYPDFSAKRIIRHLTESGDLDPKLAGKTIYKKRLNTFRALTILDQGVGATGVIANNANVINPKNFSIEKSDSQTTTGLFQINTLKNKLKAALKNKGKFKKKTAPLKKKVNRKLSGKERAPSGRQ